MPHIAFLSTDNLEDFFVYDELLIPHFSELGWTVSTVSWHDKTANWDAFDYVIVRSTWDYQQNPRAFLDCLSSIENSTAVLLNPLSLMQWNIKKHYLRDLARAGVPIVPTKWHDAGDNTVIKNVEDAFHRFDVNAVVLKPVLSANADDTYKLLQDDYVPLAAELNATFEFKDYMIQPFLDSVVSEGEFSLFYFGDQFSHAIKKVPKDGDFRVQEEHGGSLYSSAVNELQREVAAAALAAMPQNALYARVDLIRHKGRWAVMELELIEPSLYFNLDELSPSRFVDAMCQFHVKHHNKSKKKSSKGSKAQ